MKTRETNTLTKKSVRGGQSKAAVKLLPPGMQYMFKTHVVPLAIRYVGGQAAWAGLDVEDVQALVSDVYGEDCTYVVERGCVLSDLVRLPFFMEALDNPRLHSWDTALATGVRPSDQPLLRVFCSSSKTTRPRINLRIPTHRFKLLKTSSTGSNTRWATALTSIRQRIYGESLRSIRKYVSCNSF